MIMPKCDKCEKELNDFGALIFSPPIKCHESEMFDKDVSYKFHIYKDCWFKMDGLKDWLNKNL